LSGQKMADPAIPLTSSRRLIPCPRGAGSTTSGLQCGRSNQQFADEKRLRWTQNLALRHNRVGQRRKWLKLNGMSALPSRWVRIGKSLSLRVCAICVTHRELPD
jgi:hypothetical protein